MAVLLHGVAHAPEEVRVGPPSLDRRIEGGTGGLVPVGLGRRLQVLGHKVMLGGGPPDIALPESHRIGGWFEAG